MRYVQARLNREGKRREAAAGRSLAGASTSSKKKEKEKGRRWCGQRQSVVLYIYIERGGSVERGREMGRGVEAWVGSPSSWSKIAKKRKNKERRKKERKEGKRERKKKEWEI